MTLYVKDFAEGGKFEFGEYTVTEAEIIKFAEKFDSQPFHVDLEAAKESMFGGLIAASWHVAVLTNQMMSDALFQRTAVVSTRGVNDLRFEKPVRPGDTLSATVRIAELSDVDDQRGSRDVTFDTATRSDSDEPVYSARIFSIVQQRPDH